MRVGVCRFGLWFVHVHWSGNTVYRVRFSRSGKETPTHPAFLLYLSGKEKKIDMNTVAIEGTGMYPRVFREVMKVPYGKTATYGEIAERVGTAPRVVGMAMARNPTPLIIPCHRIVGKKSLGGFTPALSLKIELLKMEQENCE